MSHSNELSEILKSLSDGDDDRVLRLAAELLVQAGSLQHRWLVVSFGKSETKPTANIRAYHVPDPHDEQRLQRGPLYFMHAVPQEPARLTAASLRTLAGDRFARLFPSGAYYLPIPAYDRLTFAGRPAGAICCDGSDFPEIDLMMATVVQVASGIALSRLNAKEADRRLSEDLLLAMNEAVAGSSTRHGACAAVLQHLNEFIPYAAGVLYLLDPDPGRNEYLIYGASRNESSTALFRSFYLREELAFTWDAAIGQRPLAGATSDVPRRAKRTNDRAFGHLRQVHEAWVLIPFVVRGRTRAVAHLEGVRFSEGATGADLELMRRLSERVGSLLDRHLGNLPNGNDGRPSIQLVEHLCEVRKASGDVKRSGFERFVRDLFSTIDGVQELVSINSTGTIPQIDGLFFVRHSSSMVVVEVKAPDSEESAVGIDALRQLEHQMTAMGASVGLLVTAGRFASDTAPTVDLERLMIVVDGGRLDRLCVLSPADRGIVFARWLSRTRRGVWLAEID